MCRAEGSVCLRHTAWLQLDRADHLQSTRTWRNHVKLEIRIWAWGMAERKQGAQCHTHSHSLKSSCFLSHIIFKKKSERIKIGNCVCILHFPGVSDGKESACNARRPSFDPWVGKIPWRREWQPSPVFLPGELHGQRRLAGYSPWGHIYFLYIYTHIHTHTYIYIVTCISYNLLKSTI